MNTAQAQHPGAPHETQGANATTGPGGLSGLFVGVAILVILIALMAYLVRGRGFNFSVPRVAGQTEGRTWLEITLGIFAMANLVTSPSADQLLGAGGIAIVLLAAAAGLAFFVRNAGLAIGILGATAAVVDLAMDTGWSGALLVGIIAVMLGWVFGAARLMSGR